MKLLPNIAATALVLKSTIRNIASWFRIPLPAQKQDTAYEDYFTGPHDCSIHALLELNPQLELEKVKAAFLACAKEWPYGGVTNREFHMALNFLEVNHTYYQDDTTLVDLLSNQKGKCVALIDYHFIATDQGKVIGRDVGRFSPSLPTHIYCYWTFP